MQHLAAMITLLVLTLGSQAAVGAGSLFTFATKGAVHMRWNAPLGQPYDGFFVERQAVGGGSWQRLNDEPVRRMHRVSEIEDRMGDNAQVFLTFFDPTLVDIDNTAYQQVMSDEIARNMIQLFSVKIPQMGEVLGELYQDRQLLPGEQFNYRVILLNGGSESPWAQGGRPVTHAEPDQVPVPVQIRGVGEENSAQIGWLYNKELSRSGHLTSYRVYRAQSPSGPFQSASVESVIPTAINGELPEYQFIDQYLENGRPYWYRVAGINVLGFESAQSEAIKIVPKDMSPPPPPEDLVGRILGESVLLQWSMVDVGDLEGFRVYRSEQPSDNYLPVWPVEGEPTVPMMSHVDEDVPEGSTYYYQVHSVDSSGNESRPSNAIQVYREDKTPPLQVSNVVAIAVDEGENPGIHLSWQANTEDDLQGYLVKRTSTVVGKGDSMTAPGQFYAENVDPLQQTEYLDPVPVLSQANYAYQIIAIDESWNRSQPSDTVFVRMPDKIAPSKPSIITVRLVEDKMVISWSANTEVDLGGYRVYRSENDERFSPLQKKLLMPDQVSYEDSPPKIDQSYHYRITAVDETGNESEPSTSLSAIYQDIVPPDAIAIARIEVEDSGLHIHWKVESDADIKRMILYRSVDSNENTAIRSYLLPEDRDYLDTEVEKDRSYSYYIRVSDKNENLSAPGITKTAIFKQDK